MAQLFVAGAATTTANSFNLPTSLSTPAPSLGDKASISPQGIRDYCFDLPGSRRSPTAYAASDTDHRLR